MAFDQEPARVPVAIGDISVQMYDPDPLGGEQVAVTYSVQVVANTGERRVNTGNLLPHLSSQQKQTLSTFMDQLRAQVEAQMLPGSP
jgi:hypothetical protein